MQREVHEELDTWFNFSKGKGINESEISDTTLLFVRFTGLWIAFSGLLMYKTGDDGRGALKEYCGLKKRPEAHNRLLKDEEYGKSVSDLAKDGVTCQRTKTYYSIDEKTNLLQVLDSVYTVRCNLFHGGKSVNDGRDYGLVAASMTIIQKLIQSELSRNH